MRWTIRKLPARDDVAFQMDRCEAAQAVARSRALVLQKLLRDYKKNTREMSS
jgi:hypothetical protein